MLGAARYAPSIFLLSIFLLIVNLHPESAKKNAIVPTSEKTNLHADPGIEHPLKPTFEDADRVAVEELTRKRYFGVAADGVSSVGNRTEPARRPKRARSYKILDLRQRSGRTNFRSWLRLFENSRHGVKRTDKEGRLNIGQDPGATHW